MLWWRPPAFRTPNGGWDTRSQLWYSSWQVCYLLKKLICSYLLWGWHLGKKSKILPRLFHWRREPPLMCLFKWRSIPLRDDRWTLGETRVESLFLETPPGLLPNWPNSHLWRADFTRPPCLQVWHWSHTDWKKDEISLEFLGLLFNFIIHIKLTMKYIKQQQIKGILYA